jgi:hypothetical protein
LHPRCAQRKFDAVYGDHIHNNSGSHLQGGIGGAADLTWQGYVRRLLVQNPSHYDIPIRSIGKAITNKFANLFEDMMKRKCNFEKNIVFTQDILNCENNVILLFLSKEAHVMLIKQTLIQLLMTAMNKMMMKTV